MNQNERYQCELKCSISTCRHQNTDALFVFVYLLPVSVEMLGSSETPAAMSIGSPKFWFLNTIFTKGNQSSLEKWQTPEPRHRKYESLKCIIVPERKEVLKRVIRTCQTQKLALRMKIMGQLEHQNNDSNGVHTTEQNRNLSPSNAYHKWGKENGRIQVNANKGRRNYVT